jgi:hypothetical protein
MNTFSMSETDTEIAAASPAMLASEKIGDPEGLS